MSTIREWLIASGALVPAPAPSITVEPRHRANVSRSLTDPIEGHPGFVADPRREAEFWRRMRGDDDRE